MASGTHSAQVRVPVGELTFPPPNDAYTILLSEKLSGAGVKNIRLRKNYPAAEYLSGRARVGQ